MRATPIIVAACCVIAASCQTPGDEVAAGPQSTGPQSSGPQSSGPRSTEPTALQSRGEYLSEALCSGCHAVTVDEISPNPQAPTFEEVANRPGLARETLGTFLHDSYNFPEQMNLEVSDEDGDAIAAYILALRDTNAD